MKVGQNGHYVLCTGWIQSLQQLHEIDAKLPTHNLLNHLHTITLVDIKHLSALRLQVCPPFTLVMSNDLLFLPASFIADQVALRTLQVNFEMQ